ncbi:MAG TPA: hypothetical protein VGH19_08345 [Verrucomicrobiae bacterium]
MKNIEWSLLIPIIAVILALVLAYFSQPKASREIGKLVWTPEYYTGMLGGVGIGILLAPAFIPPEKRVGSLLAVGIAFACIFAASFIRDNFLNRKARLDPQPDNTSQHNHPA